MSSSSSSSPPQPPRTFAQVAIEFLAKYLPHRLIVGVLRLLNRLMFWLVPLRRVRQYLLRAQQRFLRGTLCQLLTSLPETGLYHQHPRVAQFRAFCIHVHNVFLQSPRTRLLLKSNEALIALVDADTDVEWLVRDALRVPLHWRLDIVDVHDRLQLLDGGKLYRSYTRAADRAAEADALPDALRQSIIDGMRDKAVAKGAPLSDAELARRVGDIENERGRARASSQAQADVIKPQLATDVHYLTFSRANRIWNELLRPIYDEYKALDRAIGTDRNSRGSGFEQLARAAAFDTVLDELERSGAADLTDGDVQRYDNVEWISSAADGGKHVGEVDVCIVKRTGRNLFRVLALVELKSHCFEVVAGHRQQRNKCVPGNRLKLADNLLVSFEAGDEWPVFVCTTIPAHDFVLGAPPELIQTIAKHFNDQFERDGITPRKQPEDASDIELHSFAERLQEAFGLDESASPERFMGQFATNVMVIVA
jgi:hypothetical protein